jgi:hypothetical protein
MAFADYFGKNLQAASLLLQGVDPDAFKATLSKETVCIAFDKNAVTTTEGRATLDLLTRLLARLYPVLAYSPLDGADKRDGKALEALAKAVNPSIELRSGSAAEFTRCIAVGKKRPSVATATKVVFVGSRNWFACISAKKPVGSADSPNPFGAGAAACLGAANIFRQTFASNLPNPKTDEEGIFSTLEMMLVDKAARNPAWTDVDLGEFYLAGCGAIGNGFLWALRELQSTGTLHAVDGEAVDLTNLQRYAMTVSGDENKPKTELAKEWLATSKIKVEPHAQHWEQYVSVRSNWFLDRVAVAVDTEKARINIQAALPRVIHNSWTQRGEAGVSRHGFMGNEACMACLYMPTQAGANLDQLVLQALRLPEQFLVQEVRRRLDLGIPTELQFLQQISQHSGIPMEQLLPFEGKKLDELYQRGVCGGMIVALRDGETARLAEVPMAFQSTFAGILLAADVYAELAALRSRLPTRTQINLLTALPQFSPSDGVVKSQNGRCICADADFIAAWNAKYGNRDSAQTSRVKRKAVKG